MRRRLLACGLAVIGLVGGTVVDAGQSGDLVVEAWISTAGPYGESWDLKLTPGGEVALQVYYPSGSLLAQFRLSDAQVADLRKALESQRFFELPAEIAPKTSLLHQPDLRIAVWLGGKRHKVALYDPGQLEADANARRFLVLWRRLFDGLPIKPSCCEPQTK
jgi:hypothetical protein